MVRNLIGAAVLVGLTLSVAGAQAPEGDRTPNRGLRPGLTRRRSSEGRSPISIVGRTTTSPEPAHATGGSPSTSTGRPSASITVPASWCFHFR